MERIQKRVLSIILSDMSYQDCLDSLGLPTLKERRNELSKRLFDSIANNSGHELFSVDQMFSKINKKLGLLKRIRYCLPLDARLLFFNSYFLPLFDYADIVWGIGVIPL